MLGWIREVKWPAQGLLFEIYQKRRRINNLWVSSQFNQNRKPRARSTQIFHHDEDPTAQIHSLSFWLFSQKRTKITFRIFEKPIGRKNNSTAGR